jgi:putative ABC transport system permease protein
MSLYENFRIAFESLWANRLRSFLALLGIVIGVFAVTSMVSLGQIASAGISQDLMSIADRSVLVQPDLMAGLNFKRLKQSDIQAFSALPVTVIPQLAVTAHYEKKPGDRRVISITGSDGDLPKIYSGVRISKGRFFSVGEARGGMAVGIINPAASKAIFGKRNPMEKQVRLFYPGGGRVDVMIIGMMEAQPAIFGGETPQIILPTPFVWRTHPDVQREQYDYAMLKVKEGYDVSTVERQTRQIIETRYDKGTFQIQSAESFQKELSSIMLILQALLGAIGGLSLLVGGIGIMNIMLVSVTERTREIGLRKALGATSKQIRLQFLIEAVVLTLLGGSVGTLLSIGVLALVVALVPFFKVFVLSPVTILLALGVSVLIGLFFGVWPASRAAKLDPIEALRYE